MKPRACRRCGSSRRTANGHCVSCEADQNARRQQDERARWLAGYLITYAPEVFEQRGSRRVFCVTVE